MKLERVTKCWVLATFLFLIGASAWAQIQVQAVVDHNSVAEGDFVQYTIRVSAKNQTVQVGDPRLPDLEGFDLVSKNESMESRHEFTNGEIQALVTQSYIYTLVASKKGSLKIGTAEVIVDGKTYSTQPITVTVSSGSGRPQKGNPPPSSDPFGSPGDDEDEQYAQLLRRQILGLQRGIQRGQPQGDTPGRAINEKEAFFLDVVTDKKEAFVGEQVTATYYLYTRHLVRDIDPLKYPTLKAFWKEDIEVPTRLDYEEVVVNGLAYKRALLASYAIFPLKPGISIVDPYRAKCTVIMMNSVMGAFGMGTPYQFSKSSPELKIQVKALPVAGLPKSFSGAVGQFDISATVPGGQKFQVGQPFSLKVRIDGRGNAKNIDLPTIEYPQALEVFDTKSDSKFFRDGRSFKEFEILLIPRSGGTVTIPSISVGIFDPRSQSFSEKTTQPISITIGGGSGADQIQGRRMDIPAEPKAEKKLSLPAPVISVGFQMPVNMGTRMLLWSTAILLSLLGLIATEYFDIRARTQTGTLGRLVNARLKVVRGHLAKGEYRQVGAQGLNLLSMVVGSATGSEGLSTHNLSHAVDQLPPSIRQAWGEALRKVSADLETLGFAPESMLGDLKEKSRQEVLVRESEKICTEILRAMESETKAHGTAKTIS